MGSEASQDTILSGDARAAAEKEAVLMTRGRRKSSRGAVRPRVPARPRHREVAFPRPQPGPEEAETLLHQTQVKDAPVTSGTSREQEGTCP